MNQIEIEQVTYQQAQSQIDFIRTQVFQIEQQISAELEFDGLDSDAIQLLACWNQEAVGTARIRTIDQDKLKIERLAVLASARGNGIATKLMEYAVQLCENRGDRIIIVHAQAYIKQLYLNLGFQIAGEPFSEAGIPHLKMIKSSQDRNRSDLENLDRINQTREQNP